jgi:hypothetical protein
MRQEYGMEGPEFDFRPVVHTIGKDFGEVPHNPQKTTKTKNINPLRLNIIEGFYTKYENEE